MRVRHPSYEWGFAFWTNHSFQEVEKSFGKWLQSSRYVLGSLLFSFVFQVDAFLAQFISTKHCQSILLPSWRIFTQNVSHLCCSSEQSFHSVALLYRASPFLLKWVSWNPHFLFSSWIFFMLVLLRIIFLTLLQVCCKMADGGSIL